MKKLAIVHFLPLELYPPVINFLNYIRGEKEFSTRVFTTSGNDDIKFYESDKIDQIRRVPLPRKNEPGISRLLKYLYFYIDCFVRLVIQRPHIVICYESFSAGPVYWYLKLFGKKSRLIIIYHEYFPPSWYERGMRIVKLFHSYEKNYLYRRAEVISQTNLDRTKLFLVDNPEIDKNKMILLPNFPSQEWNTGQENSLHEAQEPIRLLHIGALSFEGMHLQHVIDFFGNKKNFTIDFYSRCTDQKIIDAINSFDNLRFMGSIEYSSIPGLKGKYDVGIVLYNGSTLNFTYNAPNKIFEYLALDLDVWCSANLLTAREYVRSTTYPKMIMVDFTKLDELDIDAIISKDGLQYERSPYFCEPVYKYLTTRINENFSA